MKQNMVKKDFTIDYTKKILITKHHKRRGMWNRMARTSGVNASMTFGTFGSL